MLPSHHNSDDSFPLLGGIGTADSIHEHEHTQEQDYGACDAYHHASLSLTMEAAMDRLGYGQFQVNLFWAAGLCFMADGLEVLLLSFLTLVLQSEKSKWQLSATEASTITASVFAGAMLGTLVLGHVSDYVGRKPVFTVTAAMIAAFGLLSGVAPTYRALLGCRFAVGFGVGGLVVPFDTLSEFLPSSHRGSHLLLVELFWTAGSILVVFFGFLSFGCGSDGQQPAWLDRFMSGLGTEEWRIFVVLCAIPCIFSVIWGLYCVPESPRWLVTCRGDNKAALKILQDAAKLNGKNPFVLFPECTMLLPEAIDDDPEPDHTTSIGTLNAGNRQTESTTMHTPSKHKQEGRHHEFAILLGPQWIKTTLYLWGTWLGFSFLYYGAFIVTTMVFAASSSSTSYNYQFKYGSLLVANIAEIVGLLVVLQLIDRIGRVPTQTMAYLFGGISVFLLCQLANYRNNHEDTTNSYSKTIVIEICILLLAFCTRMLMMSASCTTWVSTAEILTTDIRATGHSAANAISRLGGFLCPYIVSPSTSLPIIGGSMLAVAIATAFCSYRLPETMGLDMGEAHTHVHYQDTQSSQDMVGEDVKELKKDASNCRTL